jgi:hypothetical protein
MPIEIRELVIKTTFEEPSGEGASQDHDLSASKEQIISECVEQVLEILKDKLER